jgi:RNA polymerase sigma-70 factor (ECF subfamily)
MAIMDTSSPPATVARRAKGSTRDERLLAGLARGEPGADRAFVRRFQHRAYGLAWAIVGDRAQAEDVAVEALSRVALCAQAYDPTRGTVTAWVLAITRERALEQRRRNHPAPDGAAAVFSRSAAVFAQLGTPEAEDDLLGERAAAVRTALSEVPVEQRRALVLAAVYGCTAQEISEIEGVPLGAARARTRSGLAGMKSLLRQEEA